MKERPLLVHFHIHHRKTGVTSSIENILPFLQEDFDTFVYGSQVAWSYYLSTKNLKEKIKKSKIAIIHAHRNNEVLKALWLRFLGYKFKLVVTRHSATPPSSLTLWLLRKADEKIGLIESMKELPFPVSIIGHGVDTDFFVPNKKVKLSQIKQSDFVLVVGRIRPKKGQETFLRAIIPVLEEKPDLAAVIVGKVDDQDYILKLRTMVEEKGLSDQVYFFEETRSILQFYQASKATVVSSHSEGFSLVCLEAMACESICVATKDVGVHSEVIEDSFTGFLFETENFTQLNQILKNIVTGAHNVSTQKARDFIQDNWSSRREALALKELYLRQVISS